MGGNLSLGMRFRRFGESPQGTDAKSAILVSIHQKLRKPYRKILRLLLHFVRKSCGLRFCESQNLFEKNTKIAESSATFVIARRIVDSPKQSKVFVILSGTKCSEESQILPLPKRVSVGFTLYFPLPCGGGLRGWVKCLKLGKMFKIIVSQNLANYPTPPQPLPQGEGRD
ncbi:hypothetical protein [Helicobacter sp. 23-1045]